MNYKQTEMMIYRMAVQLEKIIKDSGIPSAEKLYKEICDIEHRLEDQKFRVAVVGEFNRGKSSFMNVLLGKQILPEDVLPTTATVNRVTYGDRPKAYLIMNDNDEKTEDIPVEDLASYVTKLTEDSAERAAAIREAVVEYPTMLCYNGIDLIDTPGMNDMEDMNAVTVSKLGEIDLAVVTVSALMPFSETERNFVIHLLESAGVCQMIFVVTHIDRVRPKDRERLIPYIENRIRTNVLEHLNKLYEPENIIFRKYHSVFDNLRLYAVSSWEGMDALTTGDMELYRKSGYLKLTEDFPEIILNSRSVQMTWNAAYRLGTVINQYFEQSNSRQSVYDQWQKRMEEVFRRTDIRQSIQNCSQRMKEIGTGTAEGTGKQDPAGSKTEVSDSYIKRFVKTPDYAIPLKMQEAGEKMLQEEKVITGKLLSSLGTVRQMTQSSIKEAMLPTIRSEYTRINCLYDQRQKEVEKEIIVCLKQELLKFSDEMKQLAVEMPDLYSMTEESLKKYDDILKQELFSNLTSRREQPYFQWVQSPVETAFHTQVHKSVLPGLTILAMESLKAGNRSLNNEIRRSYVKMSAAAQKLADNLKNDILSGIYSLKEQEKKDESVSSQLREMQKLCCTISENCN